MAPRTIDNLGVEISTRYAQDQKDLETKYINESQGIHSQTEVEAVTPSFPSEISQMFGLEKRNLTWAAFFAPPKYNEQKKRLFSHTIIPLLGTPEKKEAQIAKITQIVPTNERPKQQSNEDKGEEKSQRQLEWEEQREMEDEEKEKKILLTLLNSISRLDKFLADVNSRRTQYQRG